MDRYRRERRADLRKTQAKQTNNSRTIATETVNHQEWEEGEPGVIIEGEKKEEEVQRRQKNDEKGKSNKGMRKHTWQYKRNRGEGYICTLTFTVTANYRTNSMLVRI